MDIKWPKVAEADSALIYGPGIAPLYLVREGKEWVNADSLTFTPVEVEPVCNCCGETPAKRFGRIQNMANRTEHDAWYCRDHYAWCKNTPDFDAEGEEWDAQIAQFEREWDEAPSA